jgi:hypothetical protein
VLVQIKGQGKGTDGAVTARVLWSSRPVGKRSMYYQLDCSNIVFTDSSTKVTKFGFALLCYVHQWQAVVQNEFSGMNPPSSKCTRGLQWSYLGL